MSADTGVLESLLSPPYDLSSFHIYGTIFDGATFERGVYIQKILVFELWRAKGSKMKKSGFFGGRFSACSKYLVELVYIYYESTCIGPTLAKKNKTKSVFVKKLKRNMTCQMPKN